MKTSIKNISNIQTGFFAKLSGLGEVVYLQSRHFNEKGELQSNLHPDLKADEISEKHYIIHGDVLFAAKGKKNFAAVYKDHKAPAVASTTFFVIRLLDKYSQQILPEYLTWYINQPKSMDLLKSKAIGTSISSISKAVLGDLKISIPSLQAQRIILELVRLKDTERNLVSKIEALREQLFQKQIINALN